MSDTWRIERRAYDPVEEAWGSWALIEEEAEIAADENEEYIYDDDGTLTHNTKYQYRVKHVGDDSDWLESNEVIFCYVESGAAGIIE